MRHRIPLYINHAPELDRREALEFGLVADGTPPEQWEGVSEEFGYFHLPEDGPIAGFVVKEVADFDPYDPEVSRIWAEPHFDAPVLALSNASAGEIVVATRAQFGAASSFNRLIFDMATASIDEPEMALNYWRNCLEAGDSMAHFALGYTLLEQGHPRDAYRHLRHYVEIASAHPWNWVWYGKAATALGETAEARAAYERALELEAETGDETDAAELLAALDEAAA